ncbi:MAG TPA: hypothetical protein VNW68_03900 [Candidatus Limnocylindria bacterium]|nr:hypothetical protein [Candidatus Limnocylindria bacterium]
MAAVLVALAGGLAAAIGALILSSASAPAEPVAVSRVETADIHALAFLGGPDRVILGHHHGILESTDGGRTWSSWGTGSDAMALGIAADQSIVIAGHDVFARGTPDGRWQDIENDLPHIDIHGFALDPREPDRMWAYLADGGLYESTDGGAHWQLVFDGHTLATHAVDRGGTTALLAVDPERAALVASDDGGRTWQPIASPPATPVYALAAARAGRTVLFSGGQGVFRSDDGGQTFSRLVDFGQPALAIAVSEDGTTVIMATRDRQVYRSDDGGRSWPGAT